MPRTVLGWRCRWGSGRSLPTSYTSPQAANKPLIVFPIHTDRGRHCLSGFTPCLSRGPWFTPFRKIWIIYTDLQVFRSSDLLGVCCRSATGQAERTLWSLERSSRKMGGGAKGTFRLSCVQISYIGYVRVQ